RAELRDLRIVEDLFPRRHLPLGPSVLHDGDELTVAPPERAQVRGVLAESRHPVSVVAMALHAPHRVELTSGLDRLRVARYRVAGRTARFGGLLLLRRRTGHLRVHDHDARGPGKNNPAHDHEGEQKVQGRTPRARVKTA